MHWNRYRLQCARAAARTAGRRVVGGAVLMTVVVFGLLPGAPARGQDAGVSAFSAEIGSNSDDPPATTGVLDAGIEAYGRGDYAEAVALWRPLAEQGNASAQFGLGLAYDRGRGVPEDPALAAQWYARAAQWGLPEANFNLGNLYLSGRGVTRDEREAARLFERAARRGMPEAQFNLGFAYETGAGVARDLPRAAAWYAQAGARGVGSAKLRLASLRRQCVEPAALAALGLAAEAPAEAASILAASATELESRPIEPGGTPALLQLRPVGQDAPAPADEAAAAVQAPTADAQPGRPAPFVRLAAYRSPEAAEKGWRLLSARHPQWLSPLQPRIQAVDLGAGKGVFFRLETGPLRDADAARALCAALKAGGDDCLVLDA
jgi:hypothetical protein